MKKILYTAVAIAFIVNSAFAQKKEKAAPGPLDKKTFVVDMIKDGKKKGEPEKQELSFKMGKFSWKTITADGYKPAAYEANFDSTANPVTCTFSAECPGDKDMVYKWDGTITDDAIEGTAVVLKKGKQKESYSFSGNLKGKKAKKE